MSPRFQKMSEIMATAPATSLSTEISARFFRIPHVIEVHVRRESDLCYVWTVVDEFSSEVRENVYRAEQQLIEDFRPAQFIFRVVPSSSDSCWGAVESFRKTA